MFDFDLLDTPGEGRKSARKTPFGWFRRHFGEIECEVYMPQDPPQAAVVFFHGSGEPYKLERNRIFRDDRTALLGERILIVLPASPMKHAGVYYWYSSDVGSIMKILQEAKDQEQKKSQPLESSASTIDLAGGRIEAPSNDPLDLLKDGEPKFLDVSRAISTAVVRAVSEEYGLPIGKVALGGFSQGAAVAADCLFHLLPEVPAALTFFAGSLMCRKRWRERFEEMEFGEVKSLQQMRVLQAHGRGDWAVGVNGGRWFRDLLKGDFSFENVNYIEYEGGHSIPDVVIDQFISLIAAL